jgi:hypothetical protein
MMMIPEVLHGAYDVVILQTRDPVAQSGKQGL